MQKLLFITDSLGLPRLDPEVLLDDDAWVTKVSDGLYNQFRFFQYLQAGLSSDLLVGALASQLGAYKPDIIVLQLGIVDSSPRTMTLIEKTLVGRLPGFLRNPILGFVRQHYAKIIKFRDISYVSPDRFQSNLVTLRNYFKSAKFVVIPIAPANSEYKLKNPLIERNIDEYNRRLELVFNSDYLHSAYDGGNVEELFMKDNHHLNIVGHSVLAGNVLSLLNGSVR